MLDLIDNDFKATIINMVKGIMILLSKYIGNLNQEMETIKPSGNSTAEKHNN